MRVCLEKHINISNGVAAQKTDFKLLESFQRNEVCFYVHDIPSNSVIITRQGEYNITINITQWINVCMFVDIIAL